MACGELGCHSATFSPQLLDELARLPYDGTEQPGEGAPKPQHMYKFPTATPGRLKKLANVDPIVSTGWDANAARTNVDYLADGGKILDEAIAADPIATARLRDALELFVAAEERSKAQVEAALAQI